MARVFVRMPSGATRGEAMATMSADVTSARPAFSLTDERVFIADLSEEEIEAAQEHEARVYADVRFEHFAQRSPLEWRNATHRYWERGAAREMAAPAVPVVGLNEVMEHIKAPAAWKVSRGGGVTIAVIDTGTCPSLAEIPPAKRSPIDIPSFYQGQHWSDTRGHGSMCATIASATADAGGRFNGVAPDATLLSARSTLWATDIYKIYEELILYRRSGVIEGPVVVSNSYGLYRCSPPNVLPPDHPYLDIVLQAIGEGIVVVFAAGNNHYDVLCNHDPGECSPTTIWGVNSHDLVLSVGTVNRDNSNRDASTPHANSSRGPGQWAERYPKPDCVAPTYGEVVWGCNYQVMDWWGTSGACPQVAGLAALILSKNPTLRPADVADIIRNTCTRLDAPSNCVGAGLIDCENAVGAA